MSITDEYVDGAAGRKSPPISIVIPCYNERRYIRACLNSILQGELPQDHYRLYVVDGLSSDGTREILQEYSERYPHLEIVDNPGANKAAGLNRILRMNRSDVFIRVDAHAVYPPDYFGRLVEVLHRHEADNAGGILEDACDQSPKSRAFSAIHSHRFAAGDTPYRTGSAGVIETDTVFGGCFRREVFDRIGYFNEKLIRAQDREFNARLKASGGKIVLDPTIRCTYFPRAAFIPYARWMYQGARWLFYARRFTNTPLLRPKNLIPLAFLLWHPVVAAGFAANWRIGLGLSAPLWLYWYLVVWFSLREARKEHSLLLGLYLMTLFPLTHFSYGLGSLIGLAQAWLKGKDLSPNG